MFWFRRDLRLDDNVGLYHALQNESKVLPIFIFDTDILSRLPKDDARVSFLFQQIEDMNSQLAQSKKKNPAQATKYAKRGSAKAKKKDYRGRCY